jgi:hypothetical protein
VVNQDEIPYQKQYCSFQELHNIMAKTVKGLKSFTFHTFCLSSYITAFLHNGLIPVHITALSMTAIVLNASRIIISMYIITVATEHTLLHLNLQMTLLAFI